MSGKFSFRSDSSKVGVVFQRLLRCFCFQPSSSGAAANMPTSCWLTCCDLADLRLHTKMLMSANAPVLANMLLLANVLLRANMPLLAGCIAQSAESK